MGDIAEDFYEGRCCCGCGQYFIDERLDLIAEHGYAALCDECYNELPREQMKHYQKSLYKVQ
jgi:hypothetical protein